MKKGNIHIIYNIKEDMYGKEKIDIMINDIKQDIYGKERN